MLILNLRARAKFKIKRKKGQSHHQSGLLPSVRMGRPSAARRGPLGLRPSLRRASPAWPMRLSSPPAHPGPHLGCQRPLPARARPTSPQTLARKRPSRRRLRPWGPLGSAVFPNRSSCLTPMSPSAPSLLHIALSRTEPPRPSKPPALSPFPW
jgi:hypothetical protein